MHHWLRGHQEADRRAAVSDVDIGGRCTDDFHMSPGDGKLGRTSLGLVPSWYKAFLDDIMCGPGVDEGDDGAVFDADADGGASVGIGRDGCR